ARKLGAPTVGGSNETIDAATRAAAEALLAARGRSVVMAGSNDEGVQVLVNSINSMLGNYGSTIDITNHTFLKQGDDAAVAQLVKDLNAGTVGALLIHGVNPAYSLPNAADFKAGLGKTFSVSFSGYADETGSLCDWIAPDNHYLESWNDHQPQVGHYALSQPAISPLFSTRQWQESLLRWSGVDSTWYDFLKQHWADRIAPGMGLAAAFTDTWNTAVQNGVVE